MSRETRWYNFVQRLIQEARDVLHPVVRDQETGDIIYESNNKDGIARVIVEVFMTNKGDLLYWIVDRSSMIEPSKDAKNAIRTMFGAGSIDDSDG